MNFLNENDIWALSFTITGRCNCYCSYCHFYAHRDRNEYNFDMPEELFKCYVQLIKTIQKNYHRKLQVRFSGGEPLAIGDKLYKYSNYIYNETGLKPYVLTNGKALNKDVIMKAKNSNISAFLVSVENPYDESEGAPTTEETLKKIKLLNSDELAVIPAVVVVRNEYFNKLKDICDYFYEKIGQLPVISELSFHAFQSPTKQQLAFLYENVKQIAKEYYGKVPIRIFPYISPELYAGGDKNYLTELDIENNIGINPYNIDEIAPLLVKKLETNYTVYECPNKECDWYEDCKVIKWIWFFDGAKINREGVNHIKDYCAMKKAINGALFDGIMEINQGSI